MKKENIIVTIYLLLSLFVSSNSFGQGWSPLGATWFYHQPGLGDIQEYYKVSYVGDTSVGNTLVKKFDVHNILYQYSPDGQIVNTTTSYRTSWLMYENNGIVYWWLNNQFEPLYHLSPQIGDSWKVTKPSDSYHPCDSSISTDSVIVDTIINQIIDGYVYTQIDTRSVSNIWSFNRYFSDIGGYHSFVPIAENTGDTCFHIDQSISYSGVLMCYYDDVKGYRKFFPGTQECNMAFMTDTDKIIDDREFQQSLISIFPNPVIKTIHITNVPEGVHSFSIYNILGQKLYSDQFQGINIEVQNLPKGIYILQLNDINNIALFSTKFLKEE